MNDCERISAGKKTVNLFSFIYLFSNIKRKLGAMQAPVCAIRLGFGNLGELNIGQKKAAEIVLLPPQHYARRIPFMPIFGVLA